MTDKQIGIAIASSLGSVIVFSLGASCGYFGHAGYPTFPIAMVVVGGVAAALNMLLMLLLAEDK